MSESTVITNIWKNEEGQFHRVDGPAIEYADGSKIWYQNGKIHRVNGPAIEWADGTKKWLQNGQLHRPDRPAIEWANGNKEWHQNGLRHRVDGPSEEYVDGTTTWYYRNCHLGNDLKGFWRLWRLLDEKGRQDVNLHIWLSKAKF